MVAALSDYGDLEDEVRTVNVTQSTVSHEYDTVDVKLYGGRHYNSKSKLLAVCIKILRGENMV